MSRILFKTDSYKLSVLYSSTTILFVDWISSNLLNGSFVNLKLFSLITLYPQASHSISVNQFKGGFSNNPNPIEWANINVLGSVL